MQKKNPTARCGGFGWCWRQLHCCWCWPARGYDWDALGRYKGDNISSLHYVRGRVVEVLRDDTKPDQLDPARSMGTQELRILLLEGANKGTEVTIANYLTRTQNVRLRQGETAIICEDLPDSADAYYTVYNYDRAPVLVLILAVFAARGGGHLAAGKACAPAGPGFTGQ